MSNFKSLTLDASCKGKWKRGYATRYRIGGEGLTSSQARQALNGGCKVIYSPNLARMEGGYFRAITNMLSLEEKNELIRKVIGLGLLPFNIGEPPK